MNINTLYTKVHTDFATHYIGYSALAIIASTCIGSIAIMTSLMHGNTPLQMVLVTATVIVCSMHNAAILTVQKPKVVLDLLVFSILVNVLITIGNALY